jgi:mannonate dehydratase
MLMPGEEPGLGVEYDDVVADSFVYESAYLPVNRLLDGSMHDW